MGPFFFVFTGAASGTIVLWNRSPYDADLGAVERGRPWRVPGTNLGMVGMPLEVDVVG
jgi:hypothetical protein